MPLASKRPPVSSPSVLCPSLGAVASRSVARSSAFRGDFVRSFEADDYSGVAACIGTGRRVVVNGKGNRYQLQHSVFVGANRFWRGALLFATKSALVAKFADDDELAAAVAGLPEKPVGLFPDLVLERDRQASAFRATNYTLHDYPWVVAQLEDWRLVVDPDRSVFRLMFVHREFYSVGGSAFNMWVYCMFADDLDIIRAKLSRFSGVPFGSYAAFWASEPSKLLPLLSSLPRFTCDVDLPDLPARPVSVRRQMRAGRCL